MKRWVCSLFLFLATVGSGWPAGLIVVDEAYGADHGRLLLDLPFNDFTRKLVINFTSTMSKESSGS